MTGSDFSKLCKSHGFARMASGLYERCIGDGVYQTICTGFRRYIDPSSPNYSDSRRKSNYIDISIQSLYGFRPEFCFMPERKSGGISPLQLKMNASSDEPFLGIEVQYEQMEEYGFDVLDAVDTQEQLLNLRLRTDRTQDGKRIHGLDLAELFLITGQGEEANYELSHCIAHHTVLFCLTNDNLLESGQYQDYCQKWMKSRERAENRAAELWGYYLTGKYQELHRYLSENYVRNMKWVEQYGIPTARNFHMRQIPEKF